MNKAETLRGQLLSEAAKLTEGDRNEAYGRPYDNLSDTADLWTAYLCAKFRGSTVDPMQFVLTTEDVAHMNTLQKIARTLRPGYRRDNYIDSAAYQAIAGECRWTEEQE
jgi:hypothetical protein